MLFPSKLLLFAMPLLTGVLAQDGCYMTLNIVHKWTESGQRYRVEGVVRNALKHDVRTMTDAVCNTYKDVAKSMASVNPQCWHPAERNSDGVIWIDTSAAHGGAGEDQFLAIYQNMKSRLNAHGYEDCVFSGP